MQHYRLRHHPAVAQDLSDIADLIAGFAGPKVALRRLAEIEVVVQHLERNPHVGTIRDDIAPGLRAIPAARKGVVCFVVDEDTKDVLIVAITYAGGAWRERVHTRG